MAASMDVVDSENGRGKSVSALSVNRASAKINKNLRRAVTQPRPAPQVYKTEPSDFRSLVQQLTGTSPPAEPNPILTPKPMNPRLQKIAPPPLRPTFSYPSVQHNPQQPQTISGFNPGPSRFSSLPSIPLNQFTPQRPSNFAMSPLSFSPLPALSPSDQIWANGMNPLETPQSAAIRQLAQSMAGGEYKQDSNGLQGLVATMSQQNANLPNSNFPLEFARFGGHLSPRFSPPFNPPFNLPSPGMLPGFGFQNHMYGFSSQFSPSAALAMDTSFTFPEPDISTSAYS